MRQSTRPAWGTTRQIGVDRRHCPVSIHAPRMGRDDPLHDGAAASPCFNPRAPHGARPTKTLRRCWGTPFQSTRPARGATATIAKPIKAYFPFQSTRLAWGATSSPMTTCPFFFRFQSTRPAWGATWRLGCAAPPVRSFNPRAPCGARHIYILFLAILSVFQSTRPVRGATWGVSGLRAGGAGFNPRAPCGARRAEVANVAPAIAFQSTRPVRGATLNPQLKTPGSIVSIHAPRAGRDHRLAHSLSTRLSFNPRAPCGARLY